MENNIILENFITIYHNHVDYDSIDYNGSDFSFQLKKEDYQNSLKIIKNIFSSVEELIGGKISIKIQNLKIENLLIFFKRIDYLSRYDEYSKDFENSKILILEEDGKTIFKNANESFSKEKSIIFNNYYYRSILNLLKSNPQFCSIKSLSNEIIIISKENGVIHIGYKNNDLRLSDLDDLSTDFILLKKRFEKTDLSGKVSENTEFIKLFVETISMAGIGGYDEIDRFFEITKGLKIILSLTERDYDNYINNFSFENIKTKFKEERNKYFENLEKNIDLISKQVVSFPLTFAATAFASYQVKDKPIILLLILIGYSLYTFIARYILGISSYNIECLEKDILKEENDIKDNYSKNYSEFEDDFTKIKNKTNKIKDLILYLKRILYVMLSLFVFYAIFQIINQQIEKPIDSISIPTNKIQFVQIDSIAIVAKPQKNKKVFDSIKTISSDSVKVISKDKKNAIQHQNLGQ